MLHVRVIGDAVTGLGITHSAWWPLGQKEVGENRVERKEEQVLAQGSV